MKKTIAQALLITLAVAGMGTAPASAAEEGGVLSVIVGMPLKAASVATTLVVGTPIAVARKIGNNTCDMTKAVAGDDSNPLMTGAVGLFVAPVGVIAGTAEGGFYGVKNSMVHVDKPFSKDQFSLGEYGN